MLTRKIITSTLLTLACSPVLSTDDYWSLTNYEDTSTGESIVALRQESVDTIPDASGKENVHPVLEFRCIPERGEAIQFQVDWQRFISSFNTEIGFRVDGGKTLWLKLGVDASNEITLARSATDVGKLIEKFSAGEKVELDVAPYSEAAVQVDFDTSTFEAAMETLKQSCR